MIDFIHRLHDKIKELRASILNQSTQYFAHNEAALEYKDSVFLMLIGLQELGCGVNKDFNFNIEKGLDFDTFFKEIEECYLETGCSLISNNDYVEYILSFLIVEGLIDSPTHQIPVIYA